MVPHPPPSIQNMLLALDRRFGHGVRRASASPRPRGGLPSLPTGCPPLDRLIGGLPRGALTELFGPEASGKSTLALTWIARAQRAGAVAVWIDVDHTLTPAYASVLGVDPQALLVSRPASGEDALGVAETLIASGAVDLVVIDFVAALVPRRELEERLGASPRDLHSRFLGQTIHRLLPCVRLTGAALLLVNQTRARLGVPIGPADRTVGEPVLKSAAALRIEVRKGPPIHEGLRLIGHYLVIRALRNPFGVQIPSVTMALRYGRGPTLRGSAVMSDVALDQIARQEMDRAAG